MVEDIVFHMIDISAVNAFILFQKCRSLNQQVEFLNRPKSYALLDFRVTAIRQLANLPEYVEPPVYHNFQSSDK